MSAVHWLRLSRSCNNACSFCAEADALDGVAVPLEQLERALDAAEADARASGQRGEVRLAGGEPTSSPHLPAVVASAARRGLMPVLVTNGRALAKAGRLAQLVALGLEGVRFSLHGATPAVHDALVGVPGAFRQTLAALVDAATTNARRTLSFVLTTENVGELAGLVALAKRVKVHELEIRDVLPMPDRERQRALRLSDAVARQALEEAAAHARSYNLYVRTIGFERAATNTRRAAFGPGARWPGAETRPVLASPIGRVVMLGRSVDAVWQGSTMLRVAEALERRGVPLVQASPHERVDLAQDDLVVCSGFPEARDLFEHEPRAHQLDVRILDFHMLADFHVFRERWVPDRQQRVKRPWWPSERLAIVSCFPGYAHVYAWSDVPANALLPHPYPVDPRDFGPARVTASTPYAFSGGKHLRDVETLAQASALRRGPERLPIRVHHEGPPGPPATGMDYRGFLEFGAFYEAVAASRFVVLPLSRDPTCAAGITVAALALSAGRAVVASATPAMRDHLDDGVNALLVEPEDPRALAAAIERLEHDPELLARLEQGARAARELSTAETLVDTLLGHARASG